MMSRTANVRNGSFPDVSANVSNGWKADILDNARNGRQVGLSWKERAVSSSKQRAVVTLLLIIFVLCTVPYYLGFRPFGEATRLFKVGSFVLLLSALYLFGAFRGTKKESS
jgi:hypothetical protein